METSSTIHAAVAIIIGVNLIVLVKSDASLLVNSETTETKVELLPREYHQELTQLLSPDLLKQIDPLHYLIRKAVKIHYNALQTIIMDLERGLSLSNRHPNRIPPVYLPYAQLLSRLLPCIYRLENVKTSIKQIQKLHTSDPLPSQSDDSTFDPKASTDPVHPVVDPEISPLYSSDIFTDPNPPSVLIDKLLRVPGNTFFRVASKLTETRKGLTNKHGYSWYETTLNRYLTGAYNGIFLRNLQRAVARLKLLQLPTLAVDQSQQKE